MQKRKQAVKFEEQELEEKPTSKGHLDPHRALTIIKEDQEDERLTTLMEGIRDINVSLNVDSASSSSS